MNFKQFISSVSAFAVASSVFAGLAITASAEDNTVTLTATGDTEVSRWANSDKSQYFENQNYGSEGTIRVNGFTDTPKKGTNWRSAGLVKFDAYQTEDKIKSAKLRLYLLSKSNADSEAVRVYSTSKSEWDEKRVVYYNTNSDENLDSVYDANATNANFIGESSVIGALSSAPIAATNVTNAVGWVEFDVTNYVADAEGGYSFVLATDSVRTPTFASKENATAANAPQLVIETTNEEVYTVTVKYVDRSGTELKQSDSVTGIFNGTTYNATDEQKADFTADNGKKYKLAADSDVSVDVNGGNAELTLTFEEASKYPVIVKTQIDSEDPVEIYNEQVYDGDSVTVGYPKYITDGSNKVKASCGETTFTKTIKATSGNEPTVIKYTKYEGTAYFFEGETIVGTPQESGRGTLSSGKGGQIGATAWTVFTASEAGIYNVEVVSYSRNTHNKPAETSIYKNDDEAALKTVNNDVSYSYPATVTAEGVALLPGDTIKIKGTGDQGSQTCVDYVLVTQTEKTDIKPTTHDEGFKFETGIEEAKANYSTLVIDGTENGDPKNAEVDITEKLNSLSGDGDVLFSVLLKDLPEDVKITSITLK